MIGGLDVVLPSVAAWVCHPGLHLLGVAADGVIDTCRGEPGVRKPTFGHDDLGGRVDLNPEMIDASRLGVGLFEDDKFEGRVGHRPIRVSVLHLVGLSAEESGVKLDRLVEVGDVDGELKPHGRDRT